MLVDDLADDTLLMGKLLVAHGCDVAACNDPRAACEVARQFKPELILLDIGMPGMSGFAVAKQLRAAELPRFLLAARTGYADPATMTQCNQAGFNLVLVKPVDMQSLANVLELARNIAGTPS
jgi:CheY-like chemotaxis protein